MTKPKTQRVKTAFMLTGEIRRSIWNPTISGSLIYKCVNTDHANPNVCYILTSLIFVGNFELKI